MESKNPIFSRTSPVGQRSWAGPSPSVSQLNDMYNAPSYAPPAARPMTIDDVVMKSAMTLGALIVSAGVAWYLEWGIGLAFVGVIVGLILGLIVSFKQSTNPALILGYAVAYGVAVGVISRFYEATFHGIVLQAVLGTMLAFVGTLVVYSLRIIRVTPKFTKFVIAAGFGALGLILINWIVGIFVSGGLGLRADSPIGWIFSVAMILLGCFFLLLDFDQIESGVRAGVPERYSWLMAFGLTVTLVWIYLEILRFISYFADSR
ncbi:Bax inhibitor-1/YccA family protein [Streptosporangiaceae bacterium NEAU-GS5]|nr:Bax inhibitor-1/YccA family protein [Streptosporangiaceae bacterium NEAU-GS5]